jgi:hypothetical protein
MKTIYLHVDYDTPGMVKLVKFMENGQAYREVNIGISYS